VETEQWKFSKKTFVPDAIKGLVNIMRDYSTLTVGF